LVNNFPSPSLEEEGEEKKNSIAWGLNPRQLRNAF
jgi:hypothetical protein